MPRRPEPVRSVAAEYFDHTIVRPYGTVVVTFEVFGSGDDMTVGIFDVRGKINVKRHWHRLIRAHMRRLEHVAKCYGASEMRVAGRKWARVLVDYQPLAGVPNGLFKRL